jgi:hypothetical protein
VTAFDFQLHPFTTPVGVGIAVYPAAALAEVIGHYREKTRDAPDDLIIAVNLLTIPDRGPCVTVFCAWFGDPRAGATTIASVLSYGNPVDVKQTEMTYRAFHCMFDNTFASGQRNYWNLDSSPNSATTSSASSARIFKQCRPRAPSSRLSKWAGR